MITRIFLPLILLTVLADLYIYRCYLKKMVGKQLWKAILWGLPSVLIIAFATYFSVQNDYIPVDSTHLFLYLFITVIIVAPKAVFTICSLIGKFMRRLTHSHRNWGDIISPVFCAVALYIIIYGATSGVRNLTVKHVEIYSKDLPVAFDGYHIVQFSDVHIGTMGAFNKGFLYDVVDSINAQHADMVAFTGDMLNARTSELSPFINILSKIKARDGVYSVFGNHDYSYYIDVDKKTAADNKRKLISLEQKCNFNVLLNQSMPIRRGNDSIIIAGEENEGKHPLPDYSDLSKTLKGVSPQTYVILLQHDPSAWNKSILPNSHVQLTLSGHTHGGQVSLLGLRPTIISYKQDYGLYQQGNRAIYVSAGVGGLIPFRFGVNAEIVSITLHKSR